MMKPVKRQRQSCWRRLRDLFEHVLVFQNDIKLQTRIEWEQMPKSNTNIIIENIRLENMIYLYHLTRAGPQ